MKGKSVIEPPQALDPVRLPNFRREIMAFALIGERLEPVAAPNGPLASFGRWLRRAQAAHTQRATLAYLLELDACRLDDLGISRADVLEALSNPDRSAGAMLSARRAHRARSWLGQQRPRHALAGHPPALLS
jgi:uncharacterized protein YjiS (DUF1127 family)